MTSLGERIKALRMERELQQRQLAEKAGLTPSMVSQIESGRLTPSLNTLGNAIETRHWAERLGFHSLIVVTSNYHMPRAMAEIEHQLPNVALLPFPVVSDRLKAEPWWTNGATAKLLVSEYLKYILTHVRVRLNPA